jgi:putative aminopeptidase FrvX
MELTDFLQKATEIDGVSGSEMNVSNFIAEVFAPFLDDTRRDNLGNLILMKKGLEKGAPRLLLCAHMDEIGLMVTRLEEHGFLRFTAIGGFDQRTLPGQEVTIYGQQPVPGIIGFKAAHLLKEEQKGKSIKMEDLLIDCGLPTAKMRQLIKPGDTVALKRRFLTLQGSCRSGKALDNRAGVAVLWQCLKELTRLHHAADVFLVATVQEEVGVRGAVTSTYHLVPDLGIAIDVCHGDFPGAAAHEVSQLGQGPAITRGPNIHPHIAEKLLRLAADYHLPHQQDVSPGPTGTDARAIQISLEGVPTGLLSIPLRYMHTSVELVDLEDIKVGGRLLAYFIASLDADFVEGLRCI